MDQIERITETICRNAHRVGLTEIAALDIRDLEFHDWVRNICKDSCKGYNKTWACPPAVGELDECRERCLSYQNMLLFNRVYKIADSFDFEGVHQAMADFKNIVDRFAAIVSPILSKSLYLTNEGCGRCKECTWPAAPCRFPDMLHHSIEGYGFIISQLAEKAGLHYMGGSNTVTFFGAILYTV